MEELWHWYSNQKLQVLGRNLGTNISYTGSQSVKKNLQSWHNYACRNFDITILVSILQDANFVNANLKKNFISDCFRYWILDTCWNAKYLYTKNHF